MKKLILALCALCAFAACDKGGDDAPKNITITGGGTNQTIYADETSVNNGEGIKFSTTGAWRTEIEEVTRAVSWITLSQTGGDKAGDYTLQITLSQNTTGKDRKATSRLFAVTRSSPSLSSRRGQPRMATFPTPKNLCQQGRLLRKS